MKNILDAGIRAGLAAAVIGAAVLFSAPAALAKTTSSSNWAGYAVHHPGVSFRQVSGTWTQPDASCIAGRSSYSAAWVGIGGYKPTSPALEQIGTEVDCNPVRQGYVERLVRARAGTVEDDLARGSSR